MKYLLFAWSQGNCAARARQQKRACPYQIGQMREAWLKGFEIGRGVRAGYERGAAATRDRRMLAA